MEDPGDMGKHGEIKVKETTVWPAASLLNLQLFILKTKSTLTT